MDLSFLLGGGGVQLPNPARDYMSAMTMAQLARQGRIGDQEERDKAEMAQAKRAAAEIFADAQARGWDVAIREGAQKNPQGAALAVAIRRQDEGTQLDNEEKRSKIRKSDADADKTGVDALAKAASDIGNVAYQEAKAPNKLSLSRVQSVAKFYKKELPPFAGDQTNPEDVAGYLQQLGAQAYDIKDRVTAELTAARDKETGRHNLSTEGLTAARDKETGRHNLSTEGIQNADRSQRWSIAKMSDERARELNQVTREAASGNRINSETQSMSKAIDSSALPNLVASGNAVEAMLDKFKGKDIPGMGATGMLPALFTSEAGKDARSTVQGMANDLLKLYSGGAVTLSEDERRTVEMMAKGLFTDQDFRNAWPRIKARVNEAQANIRAGYSPEAVTTYEQRGGRGLRPIGSGGSAPISGGRAGAVDGDAPAVPSKPDLGEVRDGYRYLGGDPAEKSNWRKL